MTKLEKVMEALDKAIRLSRKTGRPEPPKKIPRTYEGMDERELKIIDRLAAMTVDERLRFNNYQCDIIRFALEFLICMLVRWIFCHFRMVIFHSVALFFTEIQVVQSFLCTSQAHVDVCCLMPHIQLICMLATLPFRVLNKILDSVCLHLTGQLASFSGFNPCLSLLLSDEFLHLIESFDVL